MICRIILFLALACAAHGAAWTLPAANQGSWADTGIPGELEQYLAGGVNDRAVTGAVINIVTAHGAANNNNRTTGSISSGSSTLAVADATGFAAGNTITIGLPAIHTLTVSSGATSTGSITIKLGAIGRTHDVSINVASGDTATQVATKIRAATFLQGSVITGGSGVDVTFTHTNPGASYSSQLLTARGVAGSFAVTQAGTYHSRVISSVAGNVITLTVAASVDLTDALVHHNTRDAFRAAVLAASPGDVIYFPAGEYNFTSGYVRSDYKDDLTIRGAGTGLTTLYVATSDPLIQTSVPQDYGTSPQTVSSTKTKGTAILTVPSGTSYSTGDFARVEYENEVDNARIQAGAAPVWSSGGYPWSRKLTARVVTSSSGSITIDPPLPGDATHLALKISKRGDSNSTTGWGFEDFSVEFDPDAHSIQGFLITAAQYCWWYNVHFVNWSMNAGNSSCIKLTDSYRCEIRKCRFSSVTPASSDGAIELGANSSHRIIDNIFEGGFGDMIYSSGNDVNCVIAYNYAAAGNLTIFHNVHPSLNLVEGNAGKTHHSDGYHGSSSHNTLYGNWFWGPSAVVLNRFKRNYVIARNTLGHDGVRKGSISWGNPNISNGDASGFAGPTGLSDQVGQIDFMQYVGTPNTYVIQESDVFAGSFWRDWEMTATLTDRQTETNGIFTVSGGDWFVGQHPSGAGSLAPVIHWNSKANRMPGRGTVTNVSGSNVTITHSSGTLPMEGTVVQVYNFNVGWQERDLDVKASSTVVHTREAIEAGGGTVVNSSADTFPASLFLTSKPAWFGSLELTPFDPDDPGTQDATLIPAGYRAINGNEDYLGPSAPSFSLQPVTQTATAGATVTLTVAGNGSPAPALQWFKDDALISGATSSSLVLTNVQLSDAGSYDCVATNSEGTATSTAAVLTVNAAPSEGGTATIQTLNVTGSLNIAAP
jgi:hypothetical protein